MTLPRLKSVVLLVIALTTPAVTFSGEPNVGEVLEPNPAFSEELPTDEFAWATVVQVLEEGSEMFKETSLLFQRLRIRITSGPSKGTEMDITHGDQFTIRPSQLLKPRERFLLVKSYKIDGSSYYYVADKSRLPALGTLALGFVALVTAVVGRRGMGAFLGLILSLGVLMFYVVPQILAGANPSVVSMVGAAAIAVVSIYLAHGLSRQTSLAVVSTLVTLCIAAILAVIFVSVLRLTGLGSEEAVTLQFGRADIVDLRGLLLGGIIIGVLGVLDDITTAQTAAVAELKHANPTLSAKELYRRGLNIGKEHILSLVNTLVLAYAGASLPIFLFFYLNTTTPWWVTLNTEFIAEEVVRTLVGSVALVLAVPIATLIATLGVTRNMPGRVHSHTYH